MSARDAPDPVVVALLALPESTPAALYGLYEVFSSVGRVWTELTGEAGTGRRMDACIVSPDGQPFVAALGAPITPHAGFADLPRADVVVVADLAFPADADPRGLWPEPARWLRSQLDLGATLCSACTGSVLLANAGLLDGEEATSHWCAADLFRRYFPAVRFRPERILCPAGPDQRIVTSGGAASWEDLALYMVARHCGEAEAVHIAKIFLFGDRSEGQLPYAAMIRPRRHDDAVVARCQEWLAEHYAAVSPVARMVELSGLAERTFTRRFRAATGYSPVEYVQTLRVEEAKQLLEATAEPTDAVARQVGYEDPAFFRRLFKRRTGVTPGRYRQRFQGLGRLRSGASAGGGEARP
jgi:transcriptional regulator GlxA family with amidase domain